MTYIAYTICETGHRWFSDLSGVCVSFDPKAIAKVIEVRNGNVEANKAHVTAMEEKLKEAREQMALPPIIDLISEHNRRAIEEQKHEQRRYATAEAIINDVLVHSIMMFDKVEDAINYSKGTV